MSSCDASFGIILHPNIDIHRTRNVIGEFLLDQSRKYPEDVLLNIHTAFIGVDYLFKSESINQDSLGKIMIEAMAFSGQR